MGVLYDQPMLALLGWVFYPAPALGHQARESHPESERLESVGLVLELRKWASRLVRVQVPLATA